MDDTTKRNIIRIAEKIAERGKNVFFTGAGISTESGIPDFRSKGGIWERFRPVYFEEFMSSEESRIEYWRRNIQFHADLLKARPNAAHMGIFELFKMGLVESVITQNVDGLHQESGLPDQNVIELHGSNRRVRCMTCRKLSSIEEAHRRIKDGEPAPACDCGGYLKPDTISFGQAMPEKEVEEAGRIARKCDCFIVVGSTLLVQPASVMPVYAKHGGAFLAIINLSETTCDDMCDVLIQESAGEAVSFLVTQVKEQV